MRRLIAIFGVLALLGVAALAQDPSTEDDNGFIINFLQNTISGPGRQIRLQGVSGALSSQARIEALTISDDRGVWLTLQGIEIDWTRRSLLLGRFNVNRLAIEVIEVARRPEAHEPALSERLPTVEAEPFALPELPVSVQIAALELPRIALGEPVLGQAATLAATGAADLARGELDASLDVQRQDGAGGSLTLALDFSNATRALDVNVRLQEPQGGVVATLLDIEDRPAIDMRLAGAGPLDALDLEFAFDAGAARIADGTVELRGTPDGLGFTADFQGGLAPVVPAPYRDFFAGDTTVGVSGVTLEAGGLRLDRLALRGAALDLTGALQTAADGFPRTLTLAGRLGDPRGPAVTLPVPGAATRLNSATLHLAYGQGRSWSGFVALDRLAAGEVEIEDLTLTLGGLAENLDDPARRNVTIALDGIATGVWSENPDLRALLGERLDMFADVALPPGGPVDVRQAQVTGNGLSLFAAGDVRGTIFDGRLAARVADLAPASGFAGRDLAGALDLRLDGTLDPLAGGFDVALDGTADGLRLGDPRLDGLLEGATTLSGRVARDAEGFRTDALRIANPQVEIASTGRVTRGASDFSLDGRLADLAAIDPRLGGAVTLTGRVTGNGRPLDVTVEVAAPEGRITDRDLADARVTFDGQVNGTDVRGALRGGATLGDQPISLAADIAVDATTRALTDLAVVIGPNRLSGEVSQATGAVALGTLTLAAPDLAPIAALALAEASGSADATIRLLPGAVGQGVEIAASARDVATEGVRLGAFDVDLTVDDALGAPLARGDLTATNLAAGGVDVERLTVTATQADATTMQVAADARLAIGTEASLTGELARLPDGFAATLETLTLRQAEIAAALAAPATITSREGAIDLTPLALDLAGGRLTAEGVIDETFDVDVALERLPLALANTVQPGLGLEGVLDGRLRVTGPRNAPDASFDLTGADIASAATRGAGLPPAAVQAMGRTADNRLQLDASVAAAGATARAVGAIPLGPGQLQLDVNLTALPLQAVDRLAGGQGLAGDVTGQAQVTGTLAAPAARFDFSGNGVTARALGEAGVAPVSVSLAGDFARQVVTLSRLEVSNGQGVTVSASGRAPLQGPGLDIRASGALPLAVANTLLAERAAQASGLVRFDLTAQGALTAPRLAGSASLQDGAVTDPLTNLRLQGIGADVGFDGQTVTLRSLRAGVTTGGEITASGTVSTASGFPADLVARFDGVRYTDGAFVSTTIDGQLRVRGPLTGGGGVVSGQIDLGPTEISVVEGLGLNAQQALAEVVHVQPSPGVEQTLERARVKDPRTVQPTGRSGLSTDIRISAPSRIFVRGRGLDVELGGELTVTGPVEDLVPVGQFNLRRGRLEVLGQRIDFDTGSLQLTGNFNPVVNLVAETRAEDVTAFVTVSGRVSSPEIVFSSEPSLPQDEVLARILFNRSVANLSAFQIAQLATAAAELAGGGGGPGILSRLRGAVGFDDLDIVTDEEGATALQAGRYIDENIYLDVQADSEGEARAQINLEVNDNLTLRGSVASDGNSTLGVFFQRDY